MTPYQQNVLDGFNDQVADFGTTVTFLDANDEPLQPAYDALIVFPTAGDQSQDAGIQLTAGGGVEMRTTDFLAAAVTRDSRFTVAGHPLKLQVEQIENDGVQSVVYFSFREVE